MTTQTPLPNVHDVLTVDSFARLALAAGQGPGSCLVATVLSAAGRSTGDLVIVADLPADPAQRTRILARTTLYLHAAVSADWTHLAYAILEPRSEGGYDAFVVIEPATPQQP